MKPLSQNKIGRRAFIAGTGASLVLASAHACRGFAGQTLSMGNGDAAYEPWTTWAGEPSDGPLALVRAAVVSANAHNTQPWFFSVTPSRIEVVADSSRNIGTVDPMLREMHIGTGCALENLALAAPAHGYACKLSLHENGSPVAVADLAPAAPSKSPLFDAIGSRHTNRGAYDTARPVGADTLSALQGLIDDQQVKVIWFSSEPERTRFGEIVVGATEAFIADPDQSRDSARWLRNGSCEIEAHRDGITVYTQGLSPLMLLAERVVPVSRKTADTYWLAATRDKHVATASAFGILMTRQPRSNVCRMKVGRMWQRMHLWATVHGLAMHPLNQPIERSEREQTAHLQPRFTNALAAVIGDPEWHPLMSFRIGYPTMDPGISPRRSVRDVLLVSAAATRNSSAPFARDSLAASDHFGGSGFLRPSRS